MADKMCKLCGKNPATVPDRESVNQVAPKVCSKCHAERLLGDLRAIMAFQRKRGGR